jgi:hypothetical protein
MEAKPGLPKRVAAIFGVGLLTGTMGCDQELASLAATTSGTFLGDVVSILVTRYLESAFGVEGEAPAEEHAHDEEHSATALHEHEH